MNNKFSPYIFGILGLMGMIILYWLLLAITTGYFWHPYFFFLEKWYLLLPLFLGFGVQMLLFQKLRLLKCEHNLKIVGASAGTNTIAMIACCAHHLAEFVPLLGLAGIATIFTKYQDWFLLLGIAVNVLGIIYMLRALKKTATVVRIV